MFAFGEVTRDQNGKCFLSSLFHFLSLGVVNINQNEAKEGGFI